MSSVEHETITVKQLYLLDAKGKLRGSLEADDEGAKLYLGSAHGVGYGITLGFSAGKPSVSLSDDTGTDRLTIGSAKTVVIKTDEERTSPVSSITFSIKTAKSRGRCHNILG